MLEYKSYIKLFLIILILLTHNINSIAQKKEFSLWEIDLYKQNQFRVSDEYASLLTNNKFIEYSIVSISQDFSRGNFKAPRDSYKNNNLILFTEGQTRINQLFITGKFELLDRTEQGANWGLSQRINSGNPFLLADSISSEWKKTAFNATCAIAYKFPNNKLSIGVGTKLISSNANRYSNPKPVLYRNLLSFSSSISYMPNANNKVSVQGRYITDKEQIESYSQGIYSSSIYKLKGLGASYDNYGLKRNSNLTSIQATILLDKYINKKISIVQKIFIDKSEDINIDNKGYRTHKKYAKYISNIYGYAIYLKKKTENTHNILQLEYMKYSGKGLLHNDNYPYYIHHKSTYKIEYSYLHDNKYECKLNVKYISDLILQRLIGNKQVLKGISGGFDFKYHESFKDFKLSIYPSICYHKNIYSSLRIIKENIVSKQLVEPNFNFLSQNYFAYKLKLRIENKLLSQHTFSEISLKYLKSHSIDGFSRKLINLKLGIIF